MNTLGDLRDHLTGAGQDPREATFSSGRLLILPRGGRVLGLFAEDDDRNFLWTHDALRTSAIATKTFFSEPGWRNPGGDRTWIAPEHELFVSDIHNAWKTYACPAALDPADYQIAVDDKRIPTLTTRTTLQLFRSNVSMNVEIEKTFASIADPLGANADLIFAGYEQTTTLRLNDQTSVGQIGLWQLLQLPPNGEMFVRTLHCSPARVWFGEVNADDLSATEEFVRYPMTDRKHTHKIGVRAIACTGRVGYVHANQDESYDLIIRNFFVVPGGNYIDPPFDDLAETGYAFQACNVAEDSIGHFAELEHHAPAIGAGTGKTESTDVSQVFAFRGSRESIASAGIAFLGKAFERFEV